MEDGVVYTRQTDTTTQSQTVTTTPESEDTMFCVQKTVEIYKMKRRV